MHSEVTRYLAVSQLLVCIIGIDSPMLDYTLVGDVGDFNFWDTAMTIDELNAITCDDRGNVATIFTMESQGETIFTEDPDICPGKQKKYVSENRIFVIKNNQMKKEQSKLRVLVISYIKQHAAKKVGVIV